MSPEGKAEPHLATNDREQGPAITVEPASGFGSESTGMEPTLDGVDLNLDGEQPAAAASLAADPPASRQEHLGVLVNGAQNIPNLTAHLIRLANRRQSQAEARKQARASKQFPTNFLSFQHTVPTFQRDLFTDAGARVVSSRKRRTTGLVSDLPDAAPSPTTPETESGDLVADYYDYPPPDPWSDDPGSGSGAGGCGGAILV